MGLVDIDTPVIEQLLRAADVRHGDVTGWRMLRHDQDYAVISVTLAGAEEGLIIKLAGPTAALPCSFDRTAAIVQLVRAQSNAPTFEALAVDVSYRDWPWRYLVMTRLPGAEWADIQPRRIGPEAHALYAALGRTVGALHTIRFLFCGEIGPDGTVIDGSEYLPALVQRAARRIADPAHAALFAGLLREHAAVFAGMHTGTLCHEDLNPHNLLVVEREGQAPVVALIDFDSAWAGCAESDLARLELWRGMVGDGFWEAYRAIAPLSPSYPARRPLYQLLWCLEYARPTPQHHADTARVCAELGIAPITFDTRPVA